MTEINQNGKTKRHETKTKSDPDTSAWILESLRQINTSIGSMDKRLRVVERNVYLAMGGFAVFMLLWATFQWFIGNFDITITPQQ